MTATQDATITAVAVEHGKATKVHVLVDGVEMFSYGGARAERCGYAIVVHDAAGRLTSSFVQKRATNQDAWGLDGARAARAAATKEAEAARGWHYTNDAGERVYYYDRVEVVEVDRTTAGLLAYERGRLAIINQAVADDRARRGVS